MTVETFLIIGATSAIGEALARRLVQPNTRFVLVGRRRIAMEHIAADLRIRGASAADVLELDLSDLSQHSRVIREAERLLGRIELAVITHGTLADQARADVDVDYALAEFTTNATATIAMMSALAADMVANERGHIVVVSSVAGDRGRGSNVLYGSAKAAVSAFASGLGQRFRKRGLLVTLVKPGFVDSPMTADFKKGILWASPDAVALRIVKAIRARTPVVYAPAFWWWVMWVIKSIPEIIFRRLPL